jgi:hypothetical protein
MRSFIVVLSGLVLVAALAAPGRAATSPTPAPSPSAPPVPPTYVRFVEADVLPGERVANGSTPNLVGRITNSLRAAAEYRFLGSNYIAFEYRRWSPYHPAGNVTQPVTATPAFVPAQRFTEQDVFINSSVWGRAHTYLATSSFIHSSNDGLPTLHADLGFGLERLPDPTRPASLFFSYFYYPEVHGRIAQPGVPAAFLRYKVQTYRVGGSLAVPSTPVFLTAGIIGDHYLAKQNAPSNATHTSATLGIGFRL